ncbi:hypothetical protein ZEAMMB73_Zm00001d037870 [Zea mays]|uniref:Uncharacterized protein n=1 Tax=Zea mays TaxID=4577 RepID=A0A1D6M1E3_MAIZE|nr:hypothetical protein ZEAMMB73_Zm00001d037870 [Zea mays]
MESMWGLGVRVRKDEKGLVTRDKVERCIKDVMDGDSKDKYRKSATMWMQKAKAAMQNGGSSDKNITEFIAKRPHAASSGRDSLHGGGVTLNREPLQGRHLHAISVYVSRILTVRETLLFAAEFRLPCALSSERKRVGVDQLGLFYTADTIIGNRGHHGTSSAAATCTRCVLVMQVAAWAWAWAAYTRSCTTTSLVYVSRPLGGGPSGGSSGSSSTARRGEEERPLPYGPGPDAHV